MTHPFTEINSEMTDNRFTKGVKRDLGTSAIPQVNQELPSEITPLGTSDSESSYVYITHICMMNTSVHTYAAP